MSGVGVGVGAGLGVGVTFGVGVGVVVGLGAGVGEAVAIGVGIGVGVGVGLQSCMGEPLLRGFGAPVEKSLALSFVSRQPFPARKSEVVLLGAGA
jgi:hypothetical protein